MAAHFVTFPISRWSSLISASSSFARTSRPSSIASWCSTKRSINKSWMSVILARSSGARPSYFLLGLDLHILPWRFLLAVPLATLECYFDNERPAGGFLFLTILERDGGAPSSRGGFLASGSAPSRGGALRLPSGFHQASIRLPSGFHQASIRLPSDG